MHSYILIILSLCLSAFFSGMEIAFVSSNKLRFELEKREKSITAKVMGFFYRHPQQYITTMLVGNNICLVVFSMLMAEWLEPYFRMFITEDLLISLLQSIVATVIVLFIGEFFPKTIFRLNPNLWLNVFSPFLFVIYVLLYPITIFTTWISVGGLRLFGVKLDEKVDDITFSRTDLMYLLQESYDSQETIENVEAEVKIFQNVLDFSKIKLRDCCIPRTEIVALPDTIAVDELKNKFIETGLSKILIYTTDIDHIIG